MRDNKVDKLDKLNLKADKPTGDSIREYPPLLKRWSSWYGAVILVLLLLILFFYLFTKHYA